MNVVTNGSEESTERVRQIILEKALVTNHSNDPLIPEGKGWIFDFRSILLEPDFLNTITDLLWEKLKQFDAVQIGGLETASIPLITSLVLRAQKDGKKVNGFYIRKTRKKSGLYRHIEGMLTNDPIILIDDLVNTGSSVYKQLSILKDLQKTVIAVLTIVRFRELEYYETLRTENIQLHSIFTLQDFGLSLGKEKNVQINPYKKRLLYTPKTAAYNHVLTKSTPALNEGAMYFGTDEGFFVALDTVSGNIMWKHRVGRAFDGKHIFSSPAIHEDAIFFGSYDGKLYALDRFYGEIRWVFFDADSIGSSPVVAPDLNLLFVGLEFGTPGAKGATAAINFTTGEKVWQHTSAAFVHATPLYIQKYAMVCSGGNDGVMRAFDARSGNVLWQFVTEGGASYDGKSGFSRGDIKLSPVYDEETDQIAFCSMDGWMYMVSRTAGELKFRAHSDYHDTAYRSGIYGSPIFAGTYVLFGSLDKYVYCYDKITGELVWKYMTGGRIFSTPMQVGKSIFIGANDGCLYELSLEDGTCISKNFFSERITNKILCEENTGTLFVTTQANDVYALKMHTGDTL